MKRTVGTCSRCGGRVSVPVIWLSTVPPVPTCERCRGTARNAYGPVVEMDPPSPDPDPPSLDLLMTQNARRAT